MDIVFDYSYPMEGRKVKSTHMLFNPEWYMARVGKFMRARLLDGCVIIGQTVESLENKEF